MQTDVPDPAACLQRLRAALWPLDMIPTGPCWNLDEVADLMPGRAPVPAAVLVGLVPRPSGLHVLLTRRQDALRHHAGQVSFPGGRVEPGDADVRDAALRETCEEIGLDSAQISPLGWLDPLATITGFTVWPLVTTITQHYIARPDPREVASVFEVPLDYLMSPENLRSNRVQWRGRPREVLEFVGTGKPEQRIWGATASILYNLRQRMENCDGRMDDPGTA